jgi:predicted nucleic acid-binding protein
VTFFVDANVLIYSAVRSPRGGACLALLEAVAEGRAAGRTSTACLEEVWHLEITRRVDGLVGLTRRAYTVLAPLLPVTDEAFRRALALDGAGLGANDRLHVGTCDEHGITTIVSADAAFDAVPSLRRVDPLDDVGMASLTERA